MSQQLASLQGSSALWFTPSDATRAFEPIDQGGDQSHSSISNAEHVMPPTPQGEVAFVVVSLPMVAAWYALLSTIPLALYARDMKAAPHRRARTAEMTLHLVDVLGGWPGGYIAQRVLRHKTAKTRFRAKFALTVAVSIALLWLLSL